MRDLNKYQSNRSSSRCPLGDLNNYKSETSISISSIYMSLGYLNKYTSDTILSMCPMGDKYKYMYKFSTVYERSEQA